MSFLQFLGYFLISTIIWRSIATLAYFAFMKYQVYKIKKKLESGELQAMMAEQMFNQQITTDDGDRTCH